MKMNRIRTKTNLLKGFFVFIIVMAALPVLAQITGVQVNEMAIGRDNDGTPFITLTWNHDPGISRYAVLVRDIPGFSSPHSALSDNVVPDNDSASEVSFRDSDCFVSCQQKFYKVVVYDSDNDTLPDFWEEDTMGSIAYDQFGDYDNDGLTNLEEFQYGVHPVIAFDHLSDDDKDGVSKLVELRRGTDPSVYGHASVKRSHVIANYRSVLYVDVLNNQFERDMFLAFCEAPYGDPSLAISTVVFNAGYNGVTSISVNDALMAAFFAELHKRGIYIALQLWSPDALHDEGSGPTKAKQILQLALSFNSTHPRSQQFDEIATDIEPQAYNSIYYDPSEDPFWNTPDGRAEIWSRYLGMLEYAKTAILGYNITHTPDIVFSEYLYPDLDEDEFGVTDINDVLDYVDQINLMAYRQGEDVISELVDHEVQACIARNKKVIMTLPTFPIGLDGVHRWRVYTDEGNDEIEIALDHLKTAYDHSQFFGIDYFSYPYNKIMGTGGFFRMVNIMYNPGKEYHTDIFARINDIIAFCYRPFFDTIDHAVSRVNIVPGWFGKQKLTDKDSYLPEIIGQFHDEHQRMKCYITLGSPDWFNESDWANAKTQIASFISYNQLHVKSARFDGIMLNIQPYSAHYASPLNWDTDAEAIWALYLDRLRYVRRQIDEYNALFDPDITLGESIAFQYDSDSSPVSNIEDVIDIVDMIEIKTYSDNAAYIIDRVQNEIEYATLKGKQVVINLNMIDADPDLTDDPVTFEDNSRTQLESVIDEVFEYYKYYDQFSGFSMTYYESYRLLPKD
jgi:hypothetical protein